ncbi:MAG: recombinase family protein [Chloroflexi bacterium]|nr:recombinase family protein [Chloroflexota bacterium]
MKAAIYCRVSTEGQEREGTSLQTQLEGCLKYCQTKGYEVAIKLSETYSGLTLERPKLEELREAVRSGAIDCVVVYSLDRFSRDPGHGAVLTDELERHGVALDAVTESVDSSDLGKFITYVRGYAAKLEAEKIKERTGRGLRERIKSGKLPSGRRARLFGYDYNRELGVRQVNPEQAQWVKQIFAWFTEERIGIDRIAYRLRDLGVPTASGVRLWQPSEVSRILHNIAYIGKTYVHTEKFVKCPNQNRNKQAKSRYTRRIVRPQEEWIEIPGATPPIIDGHIYEAAQAILVRNRQTASRNRKNNYLLANRLLCSHCGRSYWGFLKYAKWGGQVHPKRYYKCRGNYKRETLERCGNCNINADRLEQSVWWKLVEFLGQPEIAFQGLQPEDNSTEREHLAAEIQQLERKLAELERQQTQLLQWALKGFPESTVQAENNRLNQERQLLNERIEALREQLAHNTPFTFDMATVKKYLALIQQKIMEKGEAGKQLAFEALGVRVWFAGDHADVKGTIPPQECIADTLAA